MTSIKWHAGETRSKMTAFVQELESKTAAELVVTVRPASGDYTAAARLFGTLLALAGLSFYLYADIEFTDDLVAPALAVLYLSATFLAKRSGALQRMLTPSARLAANVRQAAREAFVDQGITVTRERSGILLYVSILERRAELVADVGILRRDTDGTLSQTFAKVTAAVAADRSLDDVLGALRTTADALEKQCPRGPDDVNELPDEVVA